LKKEAKNFLNWAVLVSPPRAQTNKSFCAAFSKKRPFLLFCKKKAAHEAPPSLGRKRPRKTGEKLILSRDDIGDRMVRSQASFVQRRIAGSGSDLYSFS
jgi:hypothetical protein